MARFVVRAIMLSASLILAACQPVPPQSPPATTAGPPETVHSDDGLDAVNCAGGMSATLSGGAQIDYRGADPKDPDRCLLHWLGKRHRLYFGFWSADPHGPLTKEARQAFRTALTGQVGTEASFRTRRARLWNRVTVSHVANHSIEVAGKQRPVVELRVVRHDAHGRPDVRAETRYAIDRATGVLLRRETVTPMANGQVTTTTSWEIDALQEAG